MKSQNIRDVVDISVAVSAELLAICFAWAYSRVVLLRLQSEMEHVYLAVIHKHFIDYWYTLTLVPFLTTILGIVVVRKDCPTGVRVVCGLSWLFALFVLCVVILAWEYAYLPVIRLAD